MPSQLKKRYLIWQSFLGAGILLGAFIIYIISLCGAFIYMIIVKLHNIIKMRRDVK